MKVLKLITFAIFLMLINSCATLKPVTHTGNTSLTGYKYAYITPTSGLSSSTPTSHRPPAFHQAPAEYMEMPMESMGEQSAKALIRPTSYPES